MSSSRRFVASALSCFFFLLCLETVTFSFPSDTEILSSVHDILPKYGLPKGLLPGCVTTYSLEADGTFEVELEHESYVQFDDLVYYSKKIKGKLSYGAISDLDGIQAKKLFVWVSVTGIEMDPSSDQIEFHVGFLSEKLPAKEFQDIPTCRKSALADAAAFIAQV